MRLFYLSDLHLADDSSPAAARFIGFLGKLPQKQDRLVLGGDIFDLFVGNKRVFRKKFAGVLAAIKKASERGVEIHYLEGNHDFHLAGTFAGLSRFHFHADEFSLRFGKKQFYFSHGDLIDPEDKGYRLLRASTKNFAFRAFVATVPNFMVDKIGNWSSHQSRKYNQTERMATEQQVRLRGLYLEFAKAKAGEGADYILIGHSHLPDNVSFPEGQYVNLGFSGEHLPYAEWSEGEKAIAVKHYP